MNVMITGANGFIGSNLVSMLSTKHDIQCVCAKRKDLYTYNNLSESLNCNNIKALVHTAIAGDNINMNAEMFYNNLLIYENINNATQKNKIKLINIGSGAEVLNGDIFMAPPPINYYGLAKHIIAKQVIANNNQYNIRVYGCFFHNELQKRFIKSNMLRYINKESMCITQDKRMDFIFMEDLSDLVYYLLKNDLWFQNIDACYEHHFYLSEIAAKINTCADHVVDICIENDHIDKDYCGDGTLYKNLGIETIGIEQGIHTMYRIVSVIGPTK